MNAPAPHPARPRGSTGPSRARRRVRSEATPRHARVPPVDYGDGLPLRSLAPGRPVSSRLSRDRAVRLADNEADQHA
jgi:hypothetical protein